ncbi:MAG: arginine repressor [Ruminococcaceae bacterium]|nr:arginine repressor [Oscillospiraceae bacterium]
MKKNRQDKILELIARYPIGTQDDLIEYLNEHGYHATQATVSRDIRALKLIKVLMEDGTYRYVLPKAQERESDSTMAALNYHKTYANSILSVAYAMNNVVIKTTPGMASAVALMLDHTNHDLMLGTVAGDDTIIVVTRSTEESRALCESIEEQRK